MTALQEGSEVTAPERLTESDVACWVIKTRTPPQHIGNDWPGGTSRTLTRCLRKSYRLELMKPGQRCLLWLSGRDQPGVQAIGTLLSEATRRDQIDPSAAEVEVAVSLYLLPEPVPRALLLADHIAARAEVLRMPAGSNPSYLSGEQLWVLRESLSATDLDLAGW